MGIDFILRCAPNFEKGWSEGLRELAAPDLFTKQPELKGRTLLAHPVEGFEFAMARDYLLQIVDNRLCVLCESRIVGTIQDPPQLLIEVLQNEAHGVTVGEVTKVHVITGVADIHLK